jgi:hypothetical protein
MSVNGTKSFYVGWRTSSGCWGRRIARDMAYKAWQDGYSVREYAGVMAVPPMTNDMSGHSKEENF